MDQRLKRQLLRQAVDENVSTIEGRALPPAAPPARRGVVGKLWWLALVPLLSAPLLWLGRTTTADSAAVPGPLGASAANVAGIPSHSPLNDDFTSQLTFPVPRPMDMRAFPLEVRRIILDPGHGGEDHGTVGADQAEKTLTLDIAQRLETLLTRDGFEVELTRRDDHGVLLKERAAFANQWQADLFVSIHINWLSTQEVRGIETYFLGPTDDPRLIEFARRENRRSGYRLAEMKPLLEDIYTDYLQGQSRQLANRVQRSLYGSLRKVNPELKDRGVKTAPFVVLVSTEMPAILAEVSCLSNQEEAELLARPYYRDHIAEALARGILGYADDVHQIDEKGS